MKINNTNWNSLVSEAEFDVEDLQPKEQLHPSFWQGLQFDAVVRSKLLKISEDLIKQLDIYDLTEDIVLTGSIASHNWHSQSDIDLHIILDFAKIDENVELVRRFLDLKRMNWNRAHNIFIKGHEVEVYFQNTSEEHKSLGLFSLKDNKWIKEPVQESHSIDIPAVEVKASAMATEIEKIPDLIREKDYSEAYHLCTRLKEKVKKLRRSGLEKHGVHSVENLAFKLLRNSGHLTQLHSLKVSSYDKMMSSPARDSISVSISEGWSEFIKSLKEER